MATKKKTNATAVLSFSIELDKLRKELESKDDARFEQMCAHLFSRLLGDIEVTVSKTGSQFGADAGTAGLRGRRLRLECKRYQQKTYLSPRGLAGEVLEASVRDKLLEAWILAATKEVSETERNLAREAGEKLGVPVVVVDWTARAAGTGLPTLAALCATWPEVVEQHMGKVAADAAKLLASNVGSTVQSLQRDLEFWNIGFATLRSASIRQLRRIWEDRADSRALLNQDAAGGRTDVRLVSRPVPLQKLKDWWTSPSRPLSPAIVTGLEGVGKTWVALDWAIQSNAELPIVVVLPASAFRTNPDFSEFGVRELLAKSLVGITKSNLSEEYWHARVNSLLERPPAEGPSFLLFIDGLNQQPHLMWSGVADALQGSALGGRVRLLATARQHYFETNLRRLGNLAVPATQVAVGPYDHKEFDELLQLHGMTRDKIHPSLLSLAATPRLFPLVHRLKDNAALQSEASVPRLLFEYGRDVLHQREQGSLTEDDWVNWLVSCAKRYHQKIGQVKVPAQSEALHDVEATLAAPHLTPEDVGRRLSDVIDGGIYRPTKSGASTKLVLQEGPAILGLGLALLEVLAEVPSEERGVLEAELEKWLEPVAAIDQTSDVLRAALAVSSALKDGDGEPVLDALLVSWMHAQNPSTTFEQDIKVFGDSFPRSMLAVVERSNARAQGAAQNYAAQSLRRVSPARTQDWQFIMERMLSWASAVVLPDPVQAKDPNHYAKRHQEELVKRIGSAEPGTRSVLTAPLNFTYQHSHGQADSAIPAILEGQELHRFGPLFKRTAIREAVNVQTRTRCWEGLAWLLRLGGNEDAQSFEWLEALADEVLSIQPEVGMHPRLRQHAAALLLRLSSHAPLEIKARSLDERFGWTWDYDKDYLSDPGRSLFELERRHVDGVLVDESIGSRQRLQKLNPYLADPAVSLPADISTELASALSSLTFEGVAETGGYTEQQHRLDELDLPAARFLVSETAQAARKQLAAFASRTGDSKYWSSLRAPELLLTVQASDRAAIEGLRTRTTLPSHEEWANTFCLQLELLHQSLEEQLSTLLAAENYYHTADLMAVVRAATSEQLEAFLRAHPANPTKVARILLEVMACQCQTASEELASTLVDCLVSSDKELRTIAFVALASCAPEVCGQKLLSISWKPDVSEPIEAHYGSQAIAVASQHFAFEDVLPMVAPWRWLDAAIARGSQTNELRIASEHLVNLVQSQTSEVPDFNALVSMRVPKAGEPAALSVSERRRQDANDPGGFARLTESADETSKRMQELAKNASESIRSIRSSGNLLYLHAFPTDSVRAAYRAAPDVWNALVVGATEEGFARRVHAAEGLYSSLCDALLSEAPANGARLWRALVGNLRTEVRGAAGIPELVHMVFRAPDSSEVDALRRHFAELTNNASDKQLLNLVLAAKLNGKDQWLEDFARADASSSYLWRKKRGLVLQAFSTCPDVDTLVWPFGEMKSSWQALESRMAHWTNRGALAKYWWHRFATASTADEAYSSWKVFLSCADRRAHIGMDSLLQSASSGTELDRLKRLHVMLNRDALVNGMVKHETKSPSLGDHLFGQKSPGEWLQMDDVPGQSAP